MRRRVFELNETDNIFVLSGNSTAEIFIGLASTLSTGRRVHTCTGFLDYTTVVAFAAEKIED
jgi:hypothetical protein